MELIILWCASGAVICVVGAILGSIAVNFIIPLLIKLLIILGVSALTILVIACVAGVAGSSSKSSSGRSNSSKNYKNYYPQTITVSSTPIYDNKSNRPSSSSRLVALPSPASNIPLYATILTPDDTSIGKSKIQVYNFIKRLKNSHNQSYPSFTYQDFMDNNKCHLYYCNKARNVYGFTIERDNKTFFYLATEVRISYFMMRLASINCKAKYQEQIRKLCKIYGVSPSYSKLNLI